MGEDKKDDSIQPGIPGFDELLKKGIPDGKSVLIEGSPGTGKTIFCLQTAYNLSVAGKKVLYMSFEESEESLREHMEDFGWKPVEMEKRGFLRIKRFSAIDIARSVEALLSAAKRELLIAIEPVLIPKDFEPEVIILDSVTSIASAFSGEDYRFRIYIEQLFRYFENKKISSFLVKETPLPTHRGVLGGSEDDKGAISFLSDGIICLYNVVYQDGARGGAIEILKMRGRRFEKITALYDIGPNGMVIYPNRELEGKYTIT